MLAGPILGIWSSRGQSVGKRSPATGCAPPHGTGGSTPPPPPNGLSANCGKRTRPHAARDIIRGMQQLATRQLTSKQAAFVEAYVNGRNITGAAIDAGYSESTASQIGSALLRVPHVQAAIHASVRHALAMDAPMARRVLVELAQNPETHPKIRLDAAKTLLDRAGHVAPRPIVEKRMEEKALHEMPIEHTG
jgi:terminase small subunit-like protein